jgi:hypothetical protein
LGKPEGTTPLLNTSIYMAEYLIRCSLGGLWPGSSVSG